MLPDISRRADASVVAALGEFGDAVAALMFKYAACRTPIAACRHDLAATRSAFDCFVNGCHCAAIRASSCACAAIVALFSRRIDNHVAAEDRDGIALAGTSANFVACAIGIIFAFFPLFDLIIAAG